MSKEIPDRIEDLDPLEAQPFLVRRQGKFISIHQRDRTDLGHWHWVLIDEDDIEILLQAINREKLK